MVLEIATILLGACVGSVAVLYAAPRGYLGHRKTKSSTQTPLDSYAAKAEQAKKVPTAAAPAASEPAPSATPKQSPAPYESVQPAPAPANRAAPSGATFGASTLAKKPTRTYRRRTAPVRNGVAAKRPVQKPKKR